MAVQQSGVPFDPLKLAESLGGVAERSQKLLLEFLNQPPHFSPPGMADATSIGSAFLELTTKIMSDPASLATAMVDLWSQYAMLWPRSIVANGSHQAKPDRRFKDPAWVDNAIFEYIKQSYLISSESILSTVRSVKGMDPHTAHKVEFFSRQFVDAISPSNFIGSAGPDVDGAPNRDRPG